MSRTDTVGPSAAELQVRPGADGVTVSPSDAGWSFLSFATRRLSGGDVIRLERGPQESVVVNLFGAPLEVELDSGARYQVTGRATVFDALPGAVYIPSTMSAVIRSASATVAVARAPTREPAMREPVVIRPQDVHVEVRGSGRSTRQVNHIVAPDFPADRLLLVEVLTPGGNWSSWPPHKHDVDDLPNEAILEEVYHYRFRRPQAWGLQRIYRPPIGDDRPARDWTYCVEDGDVVLVPDGYHPFVANDHDDAYYLNALAGDHRTMACSFDPQLADVMARWPTIARDERVPFVPRPDVEG